MNTRESTTSHKPKRSLVPGAVVVILLLVSGGVAKAWCQDRRFSVDDLFTLRSMAALAPSPDGRTVAAVVQRSWNDPLAFRPYEMAGFDHADIWLIDVESGEAENVTEDESTCSRRPCD